MRTESPGTREKILGAAIDVMRTRGVGSATTRAIAAEAGISEGLIYRYFENKLDVLRTAVREYLAPAFAEALRELPAHLGTGSPAEHLERIALAAIAYYRDLVPVMAALFSDNALLEWYRTSLAAREAGPQRAIAIVGDYIGREQELRRIDPALEPLAAAQMLLGACFQHVFFTLTVGPDRLALADRELVRGIAHNLVPDITQTSPRSHR
jgi:AcrR family transcriptional regulator